MTRLRNILVPAVLLAGCGGGDGKAGLLLALTREIGGELFVSAMLWSALGTAVGTVLAVVCHCALQAVGGLRWDWPPARALRWLSLFCLVLLFASFVGSAGFCEGVLRSTDWALTESEVVTEHYPALGSVGADFVAAVRFIAPRVRSPDEVTSDEVRRAIEDFRNDDVQIDPQELQRVLDGLSAAAIDAVVPDVRAAAREKFPSLRDGWGEKVLDTFLPLFGKFLLRRTAREVDEDVPEAGAGVASWLARAARLEGDPDLVSHRELSRHLVQSMVGVLQKTVIRPTVRAKQIVLLLPLPFLLLLPVAFFRGAHFLHTRWKR